MEKKTIAEQLVESFVKLLKVKTLITLPLTATFVYLAVAKIIEPKEFVGLYMMIIGFYFGTQKATE